MRNFTDGVLDEARKVFLMRRQPVLTGCLDKERAFRKDFDEGPIGFEYEGKNYEIHHKGFKRGEIHDTPIKVDVLLVLTFNPRGDASVYADGVEVIPCE